MAIFVQCSNIENGTYIQRIYVVVKLKTSLFTYIALEEKTVHQGSDREGNLMHE